MKDMKATEAIEMMGRCAAEIKNLRREIDRLGPKADAYDNLAIVLGLFPKRSQGMSEDLVWVLEKRIADLKAEARPPGPNKDTP